jgi:endonuclease III related protein
LKSSTAKKQEGKVRAMYRKRTRGWGRQHRWPAETAFEVIVGAILTQNTSWPNVERAIASLRAADKLSIEGIRELPLRKLQRLIRSSGYFRQKAQRLKNFVAFLDARYAGSMERMFATPTETSRTELLALNGVGPETADSILLYAGSHAIFVVDAYTRRILERHEVVNAGAKYDEIRDLVERALHRESPEFLAGRVTQGERPTAHLAFSNEHGTTQSAHSGLQRDPWIVRAGRKTLLPEECGPMRELSIAFVA